jgi:putative endonuclease
MWCVYVIKSKSKHWFYIGSTNRLEKRLTEHNNGKVLSTKSYRPYILIRVFKFELETEARAYEKFLKDKRIEKEKNIREYENQIQ